MPTQEKIDSVEEFKTRLDGAKTVLVTEYRGLTVRQLSDLRKQLRGVSAQYKVMKNRLAKLAMTDSELTSNLVTFINTGYEVSAIALTWALWLIAKDQETQERSRK